MGQRSPTIPHTVTPCDGETPLAACSFDHPRFERDPGTSIAATGCCTGCTGKDRVPQHPLYPWGPAKPLHYCGALGRQGAAGDVSALLAAPAHPSISWAQLPGHLWVIHLLNMLQAISFN